MSVVKGQFIILTIVLLAVLSAVALDSGGQCETRYDSEDKNNLLKVGVEAPDWTLQRADGRAVHLSSFRGKVVVLDFWATWCRPCTQMMPQMQELQDVFRESGLVVQGVNSWEENDPSAMMAKKGARYPLLLNGESIANSYGVRLLPVVYVIGRDGRIAYRHEGADKTLRKAIENSLKVPDTQTS